MYTQNHTRWWAGLLWISDVSSVREYDGDPYVAWRSQYSQVESCELIGQQLIEKYNIIEPPLLC